MEKAKDVKIVKADVVICPVGNHVVLARQCLKCSFYKGTNGKATVIKCERV